MLRSAILTLTLALASSATATPQPPLPARAPLCKTSASADINRASVNELMQFPGMTRVWAERIVRFRPYRSKQDLTENGVLPGAVYRKIKDCVIAHRVKP